MSGEVLGRVTLLGSAIVRAAEPASTRRPVLPRAILGGSRPGVEAVTVAYTSMSYAAALVRLATSRGAVLSRLLDGTGVTPHDLTELDARVTTAQFVKMAENAIAETGDPTLGLRLGRGLDILAHGFAGYAALDKPTLARAMDLFMSTARTRTTTFDIAVGQSGGETYLDFEPAEPLGTGLAFCVEVTFTSVSAMAATLLGVRNPITGGRAEVAYERPPHADAYEAFDMLNVSFGCRHNRLYIPHRLLAQRLVLASSFSTGHADKELSRAVVEAEAPRDIVERLRSMLARRLDAPPSLDDAADYLGLSSRTLRRRLGERGTTFVAVLDELRTKQAKRWVVEGGVPLSRVAERLGYSDAANFRRAFKKWTGKTPSAYREMHWARDGSG